MLRFHLFHQPDRLLRHRHDAVVVWGVDHAGG